MSDRPVESNGLEFHTSVQDRSEMFDNLSSDFLMANSYRARLFTQLRRRLQKSLARKPLLNRELLS